ncbi:hypothetical protein [Ruegeria atlantica]|uniref:hypothetical protein n=1 Tax=Ruegeria atlantica TaxID=81569 RepID=UPI00147D350D|nr:hypothetical protein [Ruegeria atlantica]
MIRFAIAILLMSSAAAMAGTKDNKLTIDHRADGFKGKAGAGWTNEDLQKNAFGALCSGGLKVADLQIQRNKKGVAKFTGKCVPQ